MNRFKKAPLTLAASVAAMLSISAHGYASYAQEAPERPAPQQGPQAIHVDVEKGQVLQVIAPQSREGRQDARRAYYEAALPPAEDLGFERIGQLNVSRKVVSDYDPGAFIFFSWPSQAAFSQFEASPEWPAIAASRPEGWDELKIYSLELKEDLKLSFHPDKHYTVVVAWTETDGEDSYERYLNGIEPAMKRFGGRFIYKMRSPKMEAHNSAPGAPAQITFVEWDSEDGFANVQKSEEYLQHRQYFARGVERFEFYWLQARG